MYLTNKNRGTRRWRGEVLPSLDKLLEGGLVTMGADEVDSNSRADNRGAFLPADDIGCALVSDTTDVGLDTCHEAHTSLLPHDLRGDLLQSPGPPTGGALRRGFVDPNSPSEDKEEAE